jgi:hypothetical protein
MLTIDTARIFELLIQPARYKGAREVPAKLQQGRLRGTATASSSFRNIGIV